MLMHRMSSMRLPVGWLGLLLLVLVSLTEVGQLGLHVIQSHYATYANQQLL